MPLTTAYTTEIKRLQILDEHGTLDQKLAKGVLTDKRVTELFRHMITCRRIDETLFKLQRSGRMGTFPQNIGQEAVSTGACAAMHDDDFLVPAYRENAGMIMRGVPVENIMLYWMGDERGSVFPEGVHTLPYAVPLATQLLHAVGIAWAAKIQKRDRAVLTFCGDGSTSEGDFHEACNFASAIGVGCVFIVQNNSWAISTPTKYQTGSETFVQKAVAYGMDCIQVDGNDLYAVHKVSKEALDRARTKRTPTLIEAVTYRLNDHTTADDARRYRDTEEQEKWIKRDPIVRTRKYLESKKLWNASKEEAAEKDAVAIVKEAVKKAEAIALPTTQSMFDSLYAEIPPELQRQRDTMHTHSLGEFPNQETLVRTPQHA